MSVTIEQDLKEILGSINQKLDNLQKDVMDIKIVQARLEEKVDSLEKDIEGVKEDTKELKGSQKAQIWTLIGILGTALLGTVIREQVKAEEQINYLTKASIGYGIEKRVGKRQK